MSILHMVTKPGRSHLARLDAIRPHTVCAVEAAVHEREGAWLTTACDTSDRSAGEQVISPACHLACGSAATGHRFLCNLVIAVAVQRIGSYLMRMGSLHLP